MDLLKKASNPIINSLVGIYIAIQLFTPYVTVNNETLVSFQAFLKYGSVHWTYNYFIFALIIPIFAYVFLILKEKLKSDIFEYGALFMWVIALIGQYIFVGYSPTMSLNEPSSLNGILTFLIILIIIFYHVMYLSLVYSVKKAVQTNKKIKELKNNKNVLYENAVLLNPSWFYFVHFLISKPLPLIATDSEFIIGNNEPIAIPFSEIKGIKLNHHNELGTLLLYLLSYITINLNNGKSYRISWASHSGLAWSDWLNAWHTNKLTKQMYEDLRQVLEGRQKISDIKWRDYYEKHRNI